MRRFRLIWLSATMATPVLYASNFDASLDAFFSAVEVRQVSISPDGRRVAWVQQPQNPAHSPAVWRIYAQTLEPHSAPVRITAGGETETSIAWSPDSRSLAFLSAQGGQSQLYAGEIAGGRYRKLTSLKGSLAEPKWSPDGKRIAVLFTRNSGGPQGPTAPKAAPIGVAEQGVPEQRIITIDVGSGAIHEITAGDLYVYDYDWSPDSKRFAASAAHGDGDNNWYLAQLYVIDALNGTLQIIWKPRFQIAVPRWSPDERNIAVIHGLMSDEGITGGDIYLVPAEGGEPRNLTSGMRASASWLSWLDGRSLLFAASEDGATSLQTVHADNGQLNTVWKGSELVSTGGFDPSISLSRDGRIQALVRHSFLRPPEVWAGKAGSWTQMTHLNADARPRWGKAANLHWKSGSYEIQGWLVYPRNYDPAHRYPMIVAVHGGPSSMASPRWPGTASSPFIYNLLSLAHEGYFVFYPNFRGSFGQGESFTQANIKDFGHGDLEDILSGIDEAVRSAPVDPQRVGIAGWSYGGYMAMWAVTQTHRFGAAIAGAGIANWQSYYGENEIDQWMIPFFGVSVYDDPDIYGRSSPLNYIRNAKTPSLVLVGERDGECPLPQSLEFWHALKTLRVPTALVVYPGEGHQISKIQHRRDILQRTLSWLNQNLGAPSATPRTSH